MGCAYVQRSVRSQLPLKLSFPHKVTFLEVPDEGIEMWAVEASTGDLPSFRKTVSNELGLADLVPDATYRGGGTDWDRLTFSDEILTVKGRNPNRLTMEKHLGRKLYRASFIVARDTAWQGDTVVARILHWLGF